MDASACQARASTASAASAARRSPRAVSRAKAVGRVGSSRAMAAASVRPGAKRRRAASLAPSASAASASPRRLAAKACAYSTKTPASRLAGGAAGAAMDAGATPRLAPDAGVDEANDGAGFARQQEKSASSPRPPAVARASSRSWRPAASRSPNALTRGPTRVSEPWWSAAAPSTDRRASSSESRTRS